MREPGLYSDYPSRMVSKFYCWCKDQGYPELDVIQYPDGEWCLIQYMQTPIIPALTKWNYVLKGIRNTEITPEFIKKYADQLNLEKHTVWEEQEKSERLALEESLYEERRSEDRADQWLKGIRNNDALMQRIAKNGLRELDPRRILNNIPRYRLGKGFRENN